MSDRNLLIIVFVLVFLTAVSFIRRYDIAPYVTGGMSLAILVFLNIRVSIELYNLIKKGEKNE